MNTHPIDLADYHAQSRGSSILYLGTAGSHGNEQLQLTLGEGWEGLTVQVVFHPCQVALQLPSDGLVAVPWEATEKPLTSTQGKIVFQGFDQDRLVNSTDLAYTVASHSPAVGRDEEPYTPGIVEGVLNQMAADKDAILAAAQQSEQAKESAAASAAAASEALEQIAAAAPAFPAVSSDAAWQSAIVKPDGSGYNLTTLAPIQAAIRPTVSGNPAVCLDSVAWAFQGLKIYGKSTQSGTPKPNSPAPIVSAGDSGTIELAMTGKNLMDFKPDQVLGAGNVSQKVAIAGGQKITVIMCQTMTAFAEEGKKSAQHWYKFTDKQGAVLNQGGICPMNFTNIGDTKTSTTVLTAPKDAVQLEIFANAYFGGNSATLINHSVMVAYGDDPNIAYVPYQKLPPVAFSTPNGLPGIPVDSNGNYTAPDGQQWLCNVKDYGAQTEYRNLYRYSVTGTENWITTDQGCFALVLENECSTSIPPLTSRYKGTVGVTDLENQTAGISDASPNWLIAIRDDTYASLDDFRSALAEWAASGQPLVILRALKSQTEAAISPQEMAVYSALTTCDDTTVVSTTQDIAGLEVQYVADGTRRLQNLENRVAALVQQ